MFSFKLKQQRGRRSDQAGKGYAGIDAPLRGDPERLCGDPNRPSFPSSVAIQLELRPSLNRLKTLAQMRRSIGPSKSLV